MAYYDKTYGELHIDIEPEKRNKQNGRFLNGHVSFNKGKTWNDYLSESAQARARKGWENLKKYKPSHRSKNAGRPKRPIIAILPDGRWFKWFCF